MCYVQSEYCCFKFEIFSDLTTEQLKINVRDKLKKKTNKKTTNKNDPKQTNKHFNHPKYMY